MASPGDIFLGMTVLVNVVLAAWVLRRTKGLTNTIHELEKNTNSIKDALIKATAESEHAKGLLEGKAFAAKQGNAPGHTDEVRN